MRLIIVTKKIELFQSILANYNLKFKILDNKDDLNCFIPKLTDKDILISFNHNIIFSDEVLLRIKIGYNIHAASLEYPGRDPHHWAIYKQAKTYGAVVHIIDKIVDSGEVVDTIYFDITENTSPATLLKKANEVAERLIAKLIGDIVSNKKIEIKKDLFWGKNKMKRQDFLDICTIQNSISEVELERRIKAFHVEGRKNIHTNISGKKFFFFK